MELTSLMLSLIPLLGTGPKEPKKGVVPKTNNPHLTEELLGKVKSSTYNGTYDPVSNITYGISEYGPWSCIGDVRLNNLQ